MELQTKVNIPVSDWKIAPCEQMLFVGSCFADNLGRRFQTEKFRATVNPRGVMYNPASILHTVELCRDEVPHVAVFTLGTNHVYRLRETGEIVDNCQKRPQTLFKEEELSVGECASLLVQAVEELQRRYPALKVVVTVSPIRYAKYGFHGSALSKATLLLAADKLVKQIPDTVTYFPAYELLNDELRDYRFYREDMLHPSDQAVEYIYRRFAETFFSPVTFEFLDEWKPIREALAHKSFHPESSEYQVFFCKTQERLAALRRKYPMMGE